MANYFYFTFGSEGQIYQGGWVKIRADNLCEAQEKFIKHFGDKSRNNGFLNYAFAYSSVDFNMTKMPKEGNLGVYCHEIID